MISHRTKEEIKEQAQRTVEIAMKKGAQTAVVKVFSRANFSLEVRNGDVENLSEARSRNLTITLSKEGRRATVATCEADEAGVNRMIDQALDMCNYTDPDDCYSLPDEDLLIKAEGNLDLFDERIEHWPIEDRIAAARELESLLKAKAPELSPDGAGIGSAVGVSALANSLGFCKGKANSAVTLGITAFAEDNVEEGDLNTGRRQLGGWTSQARHMEDLQKHEEIADLAVEQVRRKLGARKPQTGSFPVYFEPKMARVLWGHLLTAMGGGAVYRKQSYLADRVGSKVCSDVVTLIDDPTIRRGLASRDFDGEGVACHRSELVSEGTLNTYTMATYSARKLGLKSTGHAGGVGNLLVAPGDLSEEEMLARMGTGVWVTNVLGQGVNTSTGDYSRGALGLWVENGQVAYPIMEFTLASNLDDMFRNIIMMGNNVYEKSAIRTPGFVVEEMKLSGA